MAGVVVVTGGSQGIGAAAAVLASQRGYAVCLSYLSAADKARAVVETIERDGGRALAVQADGGKEDDVARLFDAAQQAFGPITALVNNAGTTGPTSSIDKLSIAAFDDVMAINVRGAFLALAEAVRRMAVDLGGPGGSIVNVSSRAAGIGSPNEFVHYAASKGAVDSLTIGAAKEVAARGIRVNAVSPGLIETDIHAKAGQPDRLERMGHLVPIGRSGSAEEVAKVILWLMSDEASYVTGAILPVSGGR